MRVKVFYELWQMECCGDQFNVGDKVSWTVFPTDNLEIGKKIEGLNYIYDVHYDYNSSPLVLEGIVKKIEVFYEKYQLIQNNNHNMYVPIPGISETIEISSSSNVEENKGELNATGYIVELDNILVEPYKK